MREKLRQVLFVPPLRMPFMRTSLNHAGLAALSVLALAACSPAPPPAAAPPAPEVRVVTLQPQKVTLSRELPGRVSPTLVAEVRPQVDGIVLRRLFEEGSQVKAGQPLYQLDDAIPRADVATLKAALARAQAVLNNARLNAARSADLAKIDAVSAQDNENAIASLQQAEADLASAKAALARGEVTLRYARITAPISGRIGESSVTAGALVTARQTEALATVQQLDPVYIDVTQSSAELLALRKQLAAGKIEGARDLPISIVLEDGSSYASKAKLGFQGVTVDPGTGSYLLRATVPNPDKLLLPGMYVRAVVGGGVRPDALLVPQQGIARDPNGDAFAMLLGADGKVEKRKVKVSAAIGDQWLVEEGLAAGDRVIVEGLQKIRAGAPARVAAPAASAPAASTPARS